MRSRRRFTVEDLRWLQSYNMTIPAIAREFGVTADAITKRLREAEGDARLPSGAAELQPEPDPA